MAVRVIMTWWERGGRSKQGANKELKKEPSDAKNDDFDHVLTAFFEKIQDAALSSSNVKGAFISVIYVYKT
jgi:hypothetical protein